jgi:DNA invertase Pin-like site-specific DNA recombinase
LWLGTKSIDVEATVARRKKFNNPKLGCVWVSVKTGIAKINKSEEQKRAVVSDKSELAFELYQKLGNQRLVAKEMRCSHQNVSRLINEYKLYHNIARRTRRTV